MESMTAGSSTIEALVERIAAGAEILEADAQLLLDTPDLITVGAIAGDVRRRIHGSSTTFVRVFEVHADAAPTRMPPRTSAGELRVVGKPASVEAAVVVVKAAVALGGGAPGTGFSLADLLSIEGSSLHYVS